MKTISELENEIELIECELIDVNEEIVKWKTKQAELIRKKAVLKQKIDKIKSDKLAKVDWSTTDHEWSEKVQEILKEKFKLAIFRPQQLSAINSTLCGQSAIVVMPTGAGKSLCYQLPALVKPGITIVISPLISLMEDQVRSLTKKNIPAALITSTSSKEETQLVLNALKDKNTPIKLIYVTPERLAKSKRFMSNLQKCYSDGLLQRIAIDEVHCCSQWGHDFRPDYKYLGVLNNLFPKTPILGLTATATSQVITDVSKMLNIQGCLIIKSTFNRPNLFYKILEKPSSQEDCLSLLENLIKTRYKDKCGIIYTHSIKDSEEIAGGLRKRNIKAAFYHANMENSARSSVHNKWHEGHYKVIVATVAFGMGIDKPDVRFVIHHTISKSMENYYQESGRAGRDGAKAECLTLYRLQDIFKVSTMVFSNNTGLYHLYSMIKYCLNGHICRRQMIAVHFEETWGESDCNQMCDICMSKPTNKEIDITKHCKILKDIILSAEKLDIRVTAQKLIDAWYLKGPVNIRSSVGAPEFSRNIGEDVLAYLIVNDYIKEDFHYTAYSTISYLKVGSNMDTLVSDRTVKMSIRKYTDFLEKTEGDTKKRKENSSIINPKKKPKIYVIESDSESE